MSITEILIKGGGVVLFVAGILLLLSAIGIHFLAIPLEPLWAVLVGVIFLGLGIWVIRGGTITP